MQQGFSASLNSILENLPAQRQTLLFSATQTRRVSDLARLSLRNAEYISVHENATSATPPRLLQLVATVPLGSKLHALYLKGVNFYYPLGATMQSPLVPSWRLRRFFPI